jgi:hypothetical protein
MGKGSVSVESLKCRIRRSFPAICAGALPQFIKVAFRGCAAPGQDGILCTIVKIQLQGFSISDTL